MKSKILFLTLWLVWPMAASPSVRETRPAEMCSIAGTVYYASTKRKPVSSVWVVLRQNAEQKGQFLTGDDGKYYIGKLDEGRYDLTVEKTGVQMYRSQINLPQDNKYDISVEERQTGTRRSR